MRITVRREHPHVGVRLEDPGCRRRLSGVVGAAMMLALLVGFGVVPGLTNVAVAAQVQTADGDPSDAPTTQDPPSPDPQPIITLPPVLQPPSPTPPRPTPTKKPTTVSSPKQHNANTTGHTHKKRTNSTQLTAASPSATASDTLLDAFAAGDSRTPEKTRDPRPSATVPTSVVAPEPTPSPAELAAQQEDTQRVSARTVSTGLPLWVPGAMILGVVLIAGSVLVRRRRHGGLPV
jgi:hypothetical protein